MSVYWQYGKTDSIYQFTNELSSGVLQFNENCTRSNYCLFYVTPVINIDGVDVIVLGESDKWVPISMQRVQLIVTTTDSLMLYVNGSINETVVFYFFINNISTNVTCKFINSNQVKVTYNASKLSCY